MTEENSVEPIPDKDLQHSRTYLGLRVSSMKDGNYQVYAGVWNAIYHQFMVLGRVDQGGQVNFLAMPTGESAEANPDMEAVDAFVPFMNVQETLGQMPVEFQDPADPGFLVTPSGPILRQ